MESTDCSLARNTNTYITILPIHIPIKESHTPFPPAPGQTQVASSGDEIPTRSSSTTTRNQRFKNKKGTLSNILLTFSRFAYHICFSPFQILEDADGQFYAKHWWPQQIICAAGTIYSIFYRVVEVRMELPKENVEWNPALYFKLFHKFLNLIFNLNIWIAMWFKKDKFIDIIQFFHTKMKYHSLEQIQQRISYAVITVGIFNTLSVGIYFLFGTDILEKSSWSPILLFKCYAFHLKHLSVCVERYDCDGMDYSGIDLSATDIILTTFFALSRLLRKVMGISEELFVLVFPLTLWVAVKDFVRYALEPRKVTLLEERPSWDSISNRYTDLKELADLVNRTFGHILLSYTLTALLYFSINLDEFLTANDSMVKFKYFVFYVFIVSTFTLSAEIVRQIGKLIPWISNNLHHSLNDMSHKELTVILHEVSSNRIAMSAYGLFNVTYSVVAQMTGVFVTYFIIMVQYREQK